MGKIGRYDYPDVPLTESIKDARKIYDRFKDEMVNADLISETIGYRGGTFLTRLASLRKYGLVTSKGKVGITELGKKITYPANKDEELEAIKEAVANVELFRCFYERFGLELPKEKFWVNLVSITGAEAPEAQAKADIIRKIYEESVAPLAIKPEVTPEKRPSKVAVTEHDFAIFETDDFKIQIRKDIRLIKFIREKLMETIGPWLDYVEHKLRVESEKESDKDA
ncbi:MAG: hypothetical protein QXO49_06780 [Candidatus Bathyarchaeia archaeon]